MIFDITNFEGNVKSLGEYLGLAERDIVLYVEEAGENGIDIDNFIEHFEIYYSKLLKKDLAITSLHVTTNNDDCKKIKEIGIINLQEALSQETQLKNYLLSFGVSVDVNRKIVTSNEGNIDISKEYDGIEVHNGIRREGLDRTIYKVYKDYQINGFFYADNVLNYGGYVNKRPEILSELAKLLNNRSIENDWIYDKENKTYVIKFFVPLSHFEDFTFDCSEHLNEEEKQLVKIKWLISKSLNFISEVIFGGILGERFSYIKSNIKVPPSNILKIYEEKEYIADYVH